MPDYYEFEVSLRHITPRIWRRFLIRKTATFHDLHTAIQDACGWWNSHLFAFRTWGHKNEDIAGIPDDDSDEPVPDAQKVKLGGVFGKSDVDKCLYEYDFGDGWEHEVKLRKLVALPESFWRRLLDGRRAFPPEDCGGVWGYQRCVKILGAATAKVDDEAEELREWLCDWTPEAFDLQAVKRAFDR
jgi:pRiA4b ORF-3-like protein